MIKILLITIGISVALLADFSRDNSTHIVTDNSTGLEWQDDTNASSITLSWQDAIDYCEALSMDEGGWRLPNFNELYSIADRSTSDPAMDSTFINIIPNEYWTSTTYANGTRNAWIVSFSKGNDNSSNKTYIKHVRCLRGRK